MYSVNIPSDSTIVQELLTKNNISFETISNNSIIINELLNDEIINEIKTYDNVFILNNDNIVFSLNNFNSLQNMKEEAIVYYWLSSVDIDDL